jgi:hypothetical protein
MAFHWRANWADPWPDFKNTHQCRNFDKLRHWAKENSLERTKEQIIHHPLNITANGMLTRGGDLQYIDQLGNSIDID